MSVISFVICYWSYKKVRSSKNTSRAKQFDLSAIKPIKKSYDEEPILTQKTEKNRQDPKMSKL